VKAPGVLGIDLQALEGLRADVLGVLDSRLGSLGERVLPKRPGKVEMPFRIARVDVDGPPREVLGILEVESAFFVVRSYDPRSTADLLAFQRAS